MPNLLEQEEKILGAINGLSETVKAERKTTSEKFEEFEKRFVAYEAENAQLKKDLTEANRHRGLYGGASRLSGFTVKSFAGPPLKLAQFKGTEEEMQALMHSSTVVRSKRSQSSDIPDLVEELKTASDRVYLTKFLLTIRSNEGTPEAQIMKALKQTDEWGQFMSLTGELLRAFDTQTAGDGLEWLATGFSSQFQEKMLVALRVGAQFEQFNMPTHTFKWPFKAGLPVAQTVAEQIASTTNPYANLNTMRAHSGTASGVGTFTERNLRVVEIITRALEDGAIPVAIDALMASVPQGLALGLEDWILNGDTAAAHLDADVDESGTSPKIAGNGLRKYIETIGAGAKHDMSVVDIANFHALRAKMGAYGVYPDKLRCFTGIWSLFKLMGLKDSSGREILITNDKLGDRAVAKTGTIGELEMIPVVPSQFVREDLDPNGVYTDGTDLKTEIVLAAADFWKIGKRPDMGLESERLKTLDQTLLVAWFHGDFEPLCTATDKSAVAGVNIATA